jgi:MFS family permease
VAIVLSIPNSISSIFFSDSLVKKTDNLIQNDPSTVYQIFVAMSCLLGFIVALITDRNGRRFQFMLMSIPFTSLTMILSFFHLKSWEYVILPSAMNYAAGFVCVFAVLRQFIDREIIVTACVVIWIIMNIFRSQVEFMSMLSQQNKDESINLICFQVSCIILPLLGTLLFYMQKKNNIKIDLISEH